MENEVIIEQNTEREAAVASKPNFDNLTAADFPELSENYVPAVKQEEKQAEEKPIVTPEEAKVTEELTLEEDKAEVVKPAEEVKEEVKPEDAEEKFELTLDEETNEGSEEGDWIEYAKSKGLEIKDNTVDAFLEAKENDYAAKIAEVDNKKMEDYFGDLDPKLRMKIELQKTGMSLSDIDAPLNNIAKFKALSDVELYREDLVTRYSNATQEWIDSEMEKAVESGQITHDATRLRLDLDNWEKEVNNQQQQIIDKYKVNSDKFLQEKRSNEIESITKAVNEMSEFFDVPLSETVKKTLVDKAISGKYDQILNDPTKKAEIIAYMELGRKAHDIAVAKSAAMAKREAHKTFHNTPPVETGGGARNTTETIGDGNFDKLKDDPFLNGKR